MFRPNSLDFVKVDRAAAEEGAAGGHQGSAEHRGGKVVPRAMHDRRKEAGNSVDAGRGDGLQVQRVTSTIAPGAEAL
jgi:hypothetical protein